MPLSPRSAGAPAAASPLLPLLLLFFPSVSSPAAGRVWVVTMQEACPAVAIAALAPVLALGTAGAHAVVDAAWLGEAAAHVWIRPHCGIGTPRSQPQCGTLHSVWVPLLSPLLGEVCDSGGGGGRSDGGWTNAAMLTVMASIDADMSEVHPRGHHCWPTPAHGPSTDTHPSWVPLPRWRWLHPLSMS